MKAKLWRWTVCALAVMAITATAMAEDRDPARWRGELSTTSQVWEFLNPQQPGEIITPDRPAHNGQPFLPSTQIVWFPGAAPQQEWLQEDMPIQGTDIGIGVLPLSGWIDVVVDNHDPKPENQKWLWVQLTWRPQVDGAQPGFDNFNPPLPAGTAVQVEQSTPLDPTGNPLGWVHTTYSWELDWNPPDEMFRIFGDINVDELVIDTWCIPEPATMSLLAVAGLAVIGRKRRG